MPDRRIHFLSVDEVIVLHERLIERFGGKSGLRDPGLLESALYRPQTGYYEDIAEMSAALFESLMNNRPFIDGNKRVAFFSTDVFLRLNGWKLDIVDREAYEFLMRLFSDGHCDYEHLLPWIREKIDKHV